LPDFLCSSAQREDGSVLFDVLIVGGGLVGVSLARALAGANVGLSVGLVDAVAATSVEHPSYDDRAIALAEGSMRILAGLGVAEQLKSQAAPIAQVHVSDRGHFGFTRLSAEQHGLAALGYVTDARTLGTVLNQVLDSTVGIEQHVPVEVVGLDSTANHVSLHVRNREDAEERILSTRLLVAADGGRSRIRELLSIDFSSHDYQQSAITANLTPSRSHAGVAYERFTSSGPMALLPMTDERCGLIWTLPTQSANQLQTLDDDDFCEQFGERFGGRLGSIRKLGKRSLYPLTLIRSNEQIRPRVVLVGNAAQTLHPVAGQGLNLGLRDVAALAETIVDTHRDAIDVGDPQRLAAYHHWRSGDQRATTWFTDNLIRTFSTNFLLLNAARSLGLVLLDSVTPVKRHFVARATGLAGRQSRLARGVPL